MKMNEWNQNKLISIVSIPGPTGPGPVKVSKWGLNLLFLLGWGGRQRRRSEQQKVSLNKNFINE